MRDRFHTISRYVTLLLITLNLVPIFRRRLVVDFSQRGVPYPTSSKEHQTRASDDSPQSRRTRLSSKDMVLVARRNALTPSMSSAIKGDLFKAQLENLLQKPLTSTCENSGGPIYS